MFKNNILSLFVFMITTFAITSIGAFTARVSKEPWYSEIAKPSFNPPDWVFAPTWFTLYFLMAIAIWLIWINPKKSNKAIKVYFLHLLVNSSWSITFFLFHQIFLSLIIIILIIFFIIWLIKLYLPINKISAYLMFPYLAWCSFAFILNFNIYLLN